MSSTMQKLKAAGDRALAGQNPYDTFLAYGLTLEDAAAWCADWAQQLSAEARALGQDPAGEEFFYRVCLGMLATGIEYGRHEGRPSSLEAAAARE